MRGLSRRWPMTNYKDHPAGSIANTLRNKRTSESADWTSALSGDTDLSVTVTLSAASGVLGRQVPTTTHDGNHGGHDE